MVFVFIRITEIFLRILIEGFLAARRAKVIGVSIVFRGPGSCGRIDVHVANGVMYSSCH